MAQVKRQRIITMPPSQVSKCSSECGVIGRGRQGGAPFSASGWQRFGRVHPPTPAADTYGAGK
jgi:hypothetical protein